jgi:phospholipase C
LKRSGFIIALTAAAFAGCNSSNAIPSHPGSQTAIKHVIIMMQENRSFDNIFAGFPGADTTLTGACIPAHSTSSSWCKTGTAKLTPVTLESTNQLGLGTDIDHSHHGFEIECDFDKATDSCRNDGFDKIRYGESGTGPPAKLYPYAYVERSESKAYWDFASRYALADHMFDTDTASSFIAHQLILSGTVALNSDESLTDQPDDMPWGCDAPIGTQTPVLLKDGREISPQHKGLPFPCFTEWGTLADLFDAGNVSWKYYVAPETGRGHDFSGGVWNGFDAIAKIRCNTYKTPVKSPQDCHGYSAAWKAHMSFPNTTFFTDVTNGTLPSVSWVIPILADSDHPAAGCNHGPHWVTSVIDAVGKSKYWDSTAIIVLWDDWGGWYDNVPPAQVNYTSLGFRVPLIVISPYARPKYVSSTDYQYGSILKYIEENFGLGSLHSTDDSSNSLADMFDYTQKPTPFVNEPLPSRRPCPDNGVTPQQIIEHDGGVPE